MIGEVVKPRGGKPTTIKSIDIDITASDLKRQVAWMNFGMRTQIKVEKRLVGVIVTGAFARVHARSSIYQ